MAYLYHFRSAHHARLCLDEEGGVILDHRILDGVCTVYTDGFVAIAAELRNHLGGMAYIESLAPSFDETNQ